METKRMSDESVRAHLLVSGRVQGVYFRATAAEEGGRLGLTGWVRNLPDGRVEAVVEGPRERVEGFVTWCGSGPPSARVTDVTTRWQEPSAEFTSFTIRR